jgi:hypothetical protein
MIVSMVEINLSYSFKNREQSSALETDRAFPKMCQVQDKELGILQTDKSPDCHL